MCIICSGNYDINSTYLNCSFCKNIKKIPKKLINLTELNCNYTKIKKIPKKFINLTNLHCEKTQIKKIPKELVNLKILYCCESIKIKEIPKELVNLTELICNYTEIKKIPKELVNLVYLDCEFTKIKKIPKELINLNNLYHNYNSCVHDDSWIKTEDEINKIIKLQKFIKLYLKLPTLWKISEYYTKKNIHQKI